MEFFAFLETLRAAGLGALVALDTEFPGCVRDGPWMASREEQYNALRCNVDLLRPIQVGLAVATEDGMVLGAWSFNLHFDLAKDLHTDSAVAFLRAAGLDFARHAAEGIDSALLGQLLAASPFMGNIRYPPAWITFSGFCDLGYLMKLLTSAPLPRSIADFDKMLESFCPRRHELRTWLPHGSLASLLHERKIVRYDTAHNAASDALATLELFLAAVPAAERRQNGAETPALPVSAAQVPYETLLPTVAEAAFDVQSLAPSMPPSDAQTLRASQKRVQLSLHQELSQPVSRCSGPSLSPPASWASAAKCSAFSTVGPRLLPGSHQSSDQMQCRPVAPPSMWSSAARQSALEGIMPRPVSAA